MNEQLIRIKHLFIRAEQIANRIQGNYIDEIDLLLLVQNLDFVVETLLKVIINTFPAPTQYPLPQNSYFHNVNELPKQRYSASVNFARTWDEVVAILRDPANKFSISQLPLRREMDKLHKLRNDSQHQGIIPNPKEVGRFVSLVESFLRDVYADVFRLDYDEVSPLSLIRDKVVRGHLENAIDRIKTGNWALSVSEASISFGVLMDVAERVFYERPLPWISLGIGLERMFSQLSKNREDIRLLLANFDTLQEQIFVIASGIDFLEYRKFRKLAPYVAFDEDKGYEADLHGKDYSEEVAKRIVNFVESFAIW